MKCKSRLIGKALFYSGILVSFFLSCKPKPAVETLQDVQLADVKLHYKISGDGFPLILIHGSLADLRYWKEQETDLSRDFQLISYSRRYNYPNQNPLLPNHSAIVEARDLLDLMDALQIEQAHILGHSYGAYTALWFAIEHPERVKKLILAEPPLMRWLPGIPQGEGIWERFLEKSWTPMGRQFIENGDRAGLEFTSQWYFQAPLDSVALEWKAYFLDNAKEWKALTTSEDAFPLVDIEKVKHLKIQTLLMSGALNAGNYNSLIDSQLKILLPNSQQIFIPDAGHEMFLDNISASNMAILNFLKK